MQDEGRWVRLTCQLCGERSPICDQNVDVRRDLLHRWWEAHKRVAHQPPPPIIEAVNPPVVPVGGQADA